MEICSIINGMIKYEVFLYRTILLDRYDILVKIYYDMGNDSYVTHKFNNMSLQDSVIFMKLYSNSKFLSPIRSVVGELVINDNELPIDILNDGKSDLHIITIPDTKHYIFYGVLRGVGGGGKLCEGVKWYQLSTNKHLLYMFTEMGDGTCRYKIITTPLVEDIDTLIRLNLHDDYCFYMMDN